MISILKISITTEIITVLIIAIVTLARSHIYSSIPMQGPSSSAAMLHSDAIFQNLSAGKESPWESSQFSAVASPSSTKHRMASHKSRDASLLKEWVLIVLALIGLESLLMDPFPMPSFWAKVWPIAGAIDWIYIIDHV
jgi:hypothetical protein